MTYTFENVCNKIKELLPGFSDTATQAIARRIQKNPHDEHMFMHYMAFEEQRIQHAIIRQHYREYLHSIEYPA